MIKKNIDLSENQIQKIRAGYKKRAPVSVRLSYEQIKGKGKYMILLNETQKKNIYKSLRLKKDLVLHLRYEQMGINHSGGFLPILVGIATAIGALAGGGAAIASAVTDAKHQRVEEEEEEETKT